MIANNFKYFETEFTKVAIPFMEPGVDESLEKCLS